VTIVKVLCLDIAVWGVVGAVNSHVAVLVLCELVNSDELYSEVVFTGLQLWLWSRKK
jgi:hypothetical protein